MQLFAATAENSSPKKENKKLNKKVDEMQSAQLGLTREDLSVVREIKTAIQDGHLLGCFMNDEFQNHVKNFKNGFRWNQEVIKHCIILHARSLGAYEYLRKSRMVLLPSAKTLRRYCGSSTADVGLTDLAIKALHAKKRRTRKTKQMAIREKGAHCGRRGSNKTRRKLFTKRRQVGWARGHGWSREAKRKR